MERVEDRPGDVVLLHRRPDERAPRVLVESLWKRGHAPSPRVRVSIDHWCRRPLEPASCAYASAPTRKFWYSLSTRQAGGPGGGKAPSLRSGSPRRRLDHSPRASARVFARRWRRAGASPAVSPPARPRPGRTARTVRAVRPRRVRCLRNATTSLSRANSSSGVSSKPPRRHRSLVADLQAPHSPSWWTASPRSRRAAVRHASCFSSKITPRGSRWVRLVTPNISRASVARTASRRPLRMLTPEGCASLAASPHLHSVALACSRCGMRNGRTAPRT